MPDMPETRVAVIGAGPAGLVTARELLRRGCEVSVFEAGQGPGGIWVPDGRSALYDSLRTNLPRDVMAFSDYTFDSRGGGDNKWPRFPHHSAVLQYLENFARHFGLTSHIRCNEAVEVLERHGHGWRLQTATTTEFADAVAVCTGHYDLERKPELPGLAHFRGRLVHSKSYRQPEPFRNRRVACWGTSASGFDISTEIASVADHVYWCGNLFSERTALGPTRTGAPSPAGFNEKGQLLLTDGPVDIDTFMYCTGYQYQFPFLESLIREDLLSVVDNRVSPLYRDIVRPGIPTLGFIGLPFLVVPFPLFELQAKWFSAQLTGEFSLPDAETQLAWCADRLAAREREGRLPRHTHQLGETQFEYCQQLADECGLESLPDWLRLSWQDVGGARQQDPANFREATLPVRGPTVC